MHLYKRIPPTALKPAGTKDVLHALEAIKPGQMVIYHDGCLASDRLRNAGVNQVGERAYDLATGHHPRVVLTQYPVGQYSYAYVAIGAVGNQKK